MRAFKVKIDLLSKGTILRCSNRMTFKKTVYNLLWC